MDFFGRYFRETWAVALYHDRFPDVRNEVREILKKTLVNILSGIDRYYSSLFRWKIVNPSFPHLTQPLIEI